MRPIHALLLVVLLVGVIVGALFLVRSEPNKGPLAPSDGQSAGVHPGTDPRSAALDVPSGSDAAQHERAKVAPGSSATGTAAGAGVHGRVVDPDSHPVAGAIVYAAEQNGPIGMALDEMDANSPWFHRVEATTDNEGKFTLKPEAKSSLRLAVRAPGFAPYDAEKPFSGGSADVGDLKLDRGAILQGHVVDASGRGVEGAELHRVRASSGNFAVMIGPSSNAPVVAKTDAGGNFRIDQIAVGPWELLVTSETHPDKHAKGETDRPGQVVANVLIQLEPGFDIAGRIVGAPATALEDLSVRAMPNSGGNDFTGFANARTGKVLKDGSFTIGGCREDQAYRVVARTREQMFGGSTRSDTVDAKAGDRDVALHYKSETALVFQVVDEDTGRPIETLNVHAGFRWPMPLIEEGTAKQRTHFDNGMVRFPSLPQAGSEDSGQVQVESAGYESYERKNLHIVAGVDNDLGKIALRHATLLNVTVVEASTGAPIEGAKVSLNEIAPSGATRGMEISIDVGGGEEDFMGSGAAHRGVTGKDGKAAVSSLPGKRATLSVSHAGHAAWKSEPLDLPPSGDSSQVVKLLSGGSVTVEVRDSAGKPVAGLSVDHRAGDDAGAMTLGNMPSDTISDEKGQVAFPHLGAGRHLFRVRLSGGGMSFGGTAVFRATRALGVGEAESEEGWTALEVIEGQSATVTLLAPAMGSLSGRVRESGKALAGATVRVKPAADDGPDFGFLDNGTNATTSSSGEYSLAGLAVGDYKITIAHTSRAMPWTDKVSVREGDNKYDADLPLAIVEGRVTGEDGKPMANVKVHAERARGAGAEKTQNFQVVMMTSDSDGESMSFGDGAGTPPVVTDAEGRYRLRGVSPSVGLNVVASAPGAQDARSERIELAPDQTRTNVDLVMKLGATVEVVTRRPDGSKGSGCIVHARPVGDDEAAPKTQFVGSTGRVTFTGLQPGRWRFTCDQAGIDTGPDTKGKIPEQEVEVKLGPPSTITFDLPS